MVGAAIRTAVFLSASVFVTTCAASSNGQSALRLRQIANASSPVYLASTASEPDNLYVVEQRGVVRMISGGRPRPRPFLDISDRVKSGGEQGLLSLAFDPAYERNRRLYVNYTDKNGNTRVVRFRSNGSRAIAASARLLLLVRQPYSNHNGGQLQFGPDGRLYLGMGDGGGAGDPDNHSQNPSSRLGKLLRADVGAAKIRWAIVGLGLRNPWRFSFDRLRGDLYIADVGQESREEVDFVSRSGLTKLANFGWSVYEGRRPFKPSQALDRRGRLVWPIYEYGHANGNCSITGGYVYRGSAQPSLRGRYFFGDYCSGRVWSLKVRSGKAVSVRREPITVPALSSFGEDVSGELYALSLEGPVYRIS